MTGASEVNPLDMMKGIMNVGVGWHPLVRELEQKLSEIDPDYTLLQVKEKFGGLRYYATTDLVPGAGVFNDIITRAEEESFHICELCGSKQDVTTAPVRSWIRSLCPRCRDEQEEMLQ